MFNSQMNEAQFNSKVKEVIRNSIGMLSERIISLCRREDIELGDISDLLGIEHDELEEVCNGGDGCAISLDTYFKLCVALLGSPKAPFEMGNNGFSHKPNACEAAHDQSIYKRYSPMTDETESKSDESANLNSKPLRDSKGRFIKRDGFNPSENDKKRDNIISQIKSHFWDSEINIVEKTTSELERFLISKLDALRKSGAPTKDEEDARYSLSRILSRYK